MPFLFCNVILNTPVQTLLTSLLCGTQVVKLKDEYISDLEGKAPKEEMPAAQTNLNEALQCAPSSQLNC